MNKLDRISNIPASITEIVDLAQMGENALFYKYKDKKDIGLQIFKELMNRFNVKQRGFFMDDTAKDVGLLSQCQSLQSLLLLTSSFGLEFDIEYPGTKSYVDENGEKISLTIRMIMDMVIEDIIRRLTDSKEMELDRIDIKGVVFGSSPYSSDAFDEEYAYIDCITWVIPTFLLVLKYHVQQHEICRFERQLIDIIKKGMDYIDEAYIPVNETLLKEKLTCGWNFTKSCEEPSLYFTFAVAECYVDFYTTFGQLIKDLEAVRDSAGKNGIPLDEETASRIREQQDKFDNINKSKDSIKYEKGEASFFGSDEYNELKRIYMEINDGKDDFSSRYGFLEKKCKEVASCVWSLVKDKFADYFFYNDLHATITEDDIKMSTTNDALFNSVYIINILLDAGIDEDINKRITMARLALDRQSEEPKERIEKQLTEATREYNNLLEICQLALQKAIRTYENLKNDSREYIVDQFLVGFNEKLEKLELKVRELRKLRIRVFSLVPLFIKTNSIISEYLIRYPQSSMKKYLGYIMDNRLYDKKNDKISWIWEKDGFFSASNYYYISALGEFYSYYEEYELDFIDAEETKNRLGQNLQEKENAYSRLVQLSEAEQKKSADIIAEQTNEIARLKQALDNFETPVEDAVRDLIRTEMADAVPQILCKFLLDASAAFAAKAMDRKAPAPKKEYSEFKAAVGQFAVASFAPIVDANTFYIDAKNKSEAYDIILKYIASDFTDVVDNYIHSICSGDDNMHDSTLKKLLDTKA